MLKPFKILLLVLMLIACFSMRLHGATFDEFAAAIHQVETGGRLGNIVGDNGHSLGPLQISRDYHADSGIRGDYVNVKNYVYACQVMRAYLARYAGDALKKNDWQTCARVHNGGPKGALKPQTIAYSRRVTNLLTVSSKVL